MIKGAVQCRPTINEVEMFFTEGNQVGLQREKEALFREQLEGRLTEIEKRLDALEKSRKQTKKQEANEVDGDSNKSAS